jgi:hypothetical protein
MNYVLLQSLDESRNTINHSYWCSVFGYIKTQNVHAPTTGATDFTRSLIAIQVKIEFKEIRFCDVGCKTYL